MMNKTTHTSFESRSAIPCGGVFACDDIPGGEIRSIAQLEDHLNEWRQQNRPTHLLPADVGTTRDASAQACDRIGDAWFDRAARLNLSKLGLPDIPGVVWEMHHLNALWLSGNRLGSVPAQLKQLDNLLELRLADNGLSADDCDHLAGLPLESLDLSGNQLKTLPAAISDLSHLQLLNLSGNPLDAANFSCLKDLPLKVLLLDGTALHRFPDELVDLAARGVQIRFQKHALDDKALADAIARLKQNNAYSLDIFTNAAERARARLSRDQSSDSVLTQVDSFVPHAQVVGWDAPASGSDELGSRWSVGEGSGRMRCSVEPTD